MRGVHTHGVMLYEPYMITAIYSCNKESGYVSVAEGHQILWWRINASPAKGPTGGAIYSGYGHQEE